MMIFVLVSCLLLASDSAVQLISAKARKSPTVNPRGFSSQCFPSRPVTLYSCTMQTEILPPISLIFNYNCKGKRLETSWIQTTVTNESNVLATQTPAGRLAVKSMILDRKELAGVENCMTCLRFTVPMIPGRHDGSFVAKVVVDDRMKDEVTSPQVKVHMYDSKDCPHVTSNTLTITVNSQPLADDTVITLNDTVEVEFLLPPANPAVKAAVYAVQPDLPYIRRQLRHSCDKGTGKCGTKVKVSDRAIPKVFQSDEDSTTIQIVLSFRYQRMTPIVFRRNLQLKNPGFKKGQF